MQPDRAERVAEIVGRALEVENGERAALIANLCGDDRDLRGEVESLLRFQEEAREFIERPAVEKVAAIFAGTNGELAAGEMLAQYKIVSLIGEGGMGEVYLAEDMELGRRVAIKLVKSGFGTREFVRHFHREERILAGLTHPNIAQLYGGAVTANGLPYFVMEYVDGTRLDHYCREHPLSVWQRLALFRKICAAVSYAHQRLVIHRDIKPANIRVTPEGEPKLLDFGIARLVDPEDARSAEGTVTFASVMTPDYASPEQVRGENITTASDVYSLGVVLYELLTEQKPYKIEHRTATEISRAITEQEPTRPSTAVARVTDRKLAIQNPKLLRGDLDNIVMKALRKEPERRYATVAQFSEDVRRHCEGWPVIARKDTLGYRASKFVARNKLAVSAAILIAMAVVIGLIVSLVEANVARRERDLAQRQKLVAQRTSSFLQDTLGAPAPEIKGADVKVVDLLSEASRRARLEAETQPEAMADVLMTLGRTYIALGLYPAAADDLRAAVAASEKANGELYSTTASSMAWLGLALMYEEQFKEGEAISRRALELQRRLHPQGSADVGVAYYSFGMNLIANGDAKAASTQLEQAVAQIGKYLGKNNGYYVATLTGLARARQSTGDMIGAETFYRRAIAAGAGIESRYRIFLAQATGYFGWLLTDKGSYNEAEQYLRQSEQIYRDVLGAENSSVPVIEASLGRLYFVKGDYASAEKEYRQAFRVIPKFFPPEHSISVGADAYFGMTLTHVGKASEGESYLRRALEIRRKLLPADHILVRLTESALAECLMAQKCYSEAEPLFMASYQSLLRSQGAANPGTKLALSRLLALYQSWSGAESAPSSSQRLN